MIKTKENQSKEKKEKAFLQAHFISENIEW